MSGFLINPYRFGRPWTPANITTALWLDAADASTITTVSGAVSEWNDKSGNGRNVSQATASRRPTLGTNLLQFSSHSLANTSYDWGASASSLFIVGRQGAGATGFQNIITTGTGAAGQWGYGISADANGDRIGIFDILQNFAPFSRVAGTSTFIGCFTTNGISAGTVSASLFADGSADASNPVTLSSTTSAAGLVIGSNATYTEPLIGEIREIVFVASVVSTNARELMEGYLAHKWGLAGSLPSGHPYKSAAPTV